MKNQFHELTLEEFLEEITRQEQSFFKKKAAESEKSYVTEMFGELYFRENPESSISHLFPPMPNPSSPNNENANKASISEAEFEKIRISEKLPNGDIALHVNEMQIGKGGENNQKLN
ncbi:uncharacterized protein LOC107791872 [Nicotiana tabacum]|uniref:Uncharacterized protein LOC107791872 n=2 Tax=Nicotiana TaxID=4085 RepID=A0A1S3ZYL0_TOBAC|nr:PREDICTED: uncharacterized protein LOC104221494 [Nicotiana sylvestris]XP_016469507.1 PREDICTED: uncharacterized protein LOC107791872 [Nicotiana tabacum]